MPFNGLKVIKMAEERKVKAYEFKAAVYPDRSGSFAWTELKKASNPNTATIEAMADFLQCPIDDLFDRRIELPTPGDNIQADHNSTAFKGTNNCDVRLLAMIEARDRQIDQLLHIIAERSKGDKK